MTLGDELGDDGRAFLRALGDFVSDRGEEMQLMPDKTALALAALCGQVIGSMVPPEARGTLQTACIHVLAATREMAGEHYVDQGLGDR